MDNTKSDIDIKRPLMGSFFEQLIVFLVLCISGNPAFVLTDSIAAKFVYIAVLLLVLLVWGVKIPSQTYRVANLFAFVLLIVFVFQYAVLGYITILGSLNTIIKFYLAICVAGYLGVRFKTIMVKVMYVIALISLPLYFMNLLGIHFPGIVPVEHFGDSIIIYYQLGENYYGQIRNCGMFWEPGAFSGYLMLTLSLFINDLSVLWKEYKKQTVVLVIALLSTQSTTGFICLIFLIDAYLLQRTKSKIYAILLIGIIMIPVTYAFTRVSFLGDKINEQFVSASETEVGEVNLGRIGTILFDWYYIKKHPLIGNGLDATTRYADHTAISEQLNAFGNGFSGIIGDLGILFIFFWFYYLFKNKTLNHSYLLVIMAILILQGEGFMKYPIFMSLPFIDYYIIHKNKYVRI